MGVLGILAILAALIGIIGSIIPGIPGPPVSWVGYLLVFIGKFTDRAGNTMSLTVLFVWLAVVVVVTILDYVIPAWFTRVTGGHKAASIGAIIGLFAGMFLTPVGMIAGSLLGAFLAEFLYENSGAWNSFKASIGAFLGFIFSTGMKIVVSGIMAYYIFVYVF